MKTINEDKYNVTKEFSIKYTFKFDFNKEINRINRTFSEDDLELKTQLIAMIDAFIDDDIDKAIDIYNDLPEYKRSECAGQECVGTWWDARISSCEWLNTNLLRALDTEHTQKWARSFAIMKAKVVIRNEIKGTEEVQLDCLD
jgi:hypothetical protein